jgi:hypothetical protein
MLSINLIPFKFFFIYLILNINIYQLQNNIIMVNLNNSNYENLLNLIR